MASGLTPERERRTCSSCQKTPNCKLKRCGRCQVVFYCSAACQREHWIHHKPHCQRQPRLSHSKSTPSLHRILQSSSHSVLDGDHGDSYRNVNFQDHTRSPLNTPPISPCLSPILLAYSSSEGETEDESDFKRRESKSSLSQTPTPSSSRTSSSNSLSNYKHNQDGLGNKRDPDGLKRDEGSRRQTLSHKSSLRPSASLPSLQNLKPHSPSISFTPFQNPLQCTNQQQPSPPQTSIQRNPSHNPSHSTSYNPSRSTSHNPSQSPSQRTNTQLQLSPTLTPIHRDSSQRNLSQRSNSQSQLSPTRSSVHSTPQSLSPSPLRFNLSSIEQADQKLLRDVVDVFRDFYESHTFLYLLFLFFGVVYLAVHTTVDWKFYQPTLFLIFAGDFVSVTISGLDIPWSCIDFSSSHVLMYFILTWLTNGIPWWCLRCAFGAWVVYLLLFKYFGEGARGTVILFIAYLALMAVRARDSHENPEYGWHYECQSHTVLEGGHLKHPYVCMLLQTTDGQEVPSALPEFDADGGVVVNTSSIWLDEQPTRDPRHAFMRIVDHLVALKPGFRGPDFVQFTDSRLEQKVRPYLDQVSVETRVAEVFSMRDVQWDPIADWKNQNGNS